MSDAQASRGARAPDGAGAVLYPIRPSEDDESNTYPVGTPTPDTEVEGGQEPADGEQPEHPAEEARAARPARDPGLPTQAERDAHAATHLPFRSWCDECVHGRCDAPAHVRHKRVAGEVPEVAFDYAFVRRDDEENVITLLVMRDRDSKALRGWVLERKGADMDENVDRAVAGIRELGYRGRVLIRCDGEGALKSLRNAITAALPDGATPVETPVGESQSNGGIEGGVRIFKGLLRVHLAALERQIGARFPSNHPVLAWLVEHVGDVISKYMMGVDGKTGYERLFGRPVREEALEFGEVLHWRHRPAKDMNVVLDPRWSSGVWLGRKWGGIIHQVFANNRVHEIRGVRRQPRALRWRKEALEAISVTPWLREPAAPGELRVLPPLAPPAAAQGGAAEPEVRVPEYNPHRVFIRLEDLEVHGFTAGCRRCILMREGRRSQGVKHRDECRNRVEQALRDAGDPRLDRAEGRVLDELERRAMGADEAGAAHAEAPVGEVPAANAGAPEAADEEPYESKFDSNGDAVMAVAAAGLTKPVAPSRCQRWTQPSAQAVASAGNRASSRTAPNDGTQTAAASEGSLAFARTAPSNGTQTVGAVASEGNLALRIAPGGGTQTFGAVASEGSLALRIAPGGGTQTFGAAASEGSLAVRTAPGSGTQTLGPAKVAELYSPPRVTATLPRLGLVAGSTFDLHADESGVVWDFTKARDRKRAWERLRAEEPFLVVGSPPCTMFSRLQLNLNASKMGKVQWERRRREAEVLLIFAVAVYALQVRAGRHFLHEHPETATSWRHPAIVKLRAKPGVDAVVAHMCQFGMTTSTAGGGQAPVKKPTRFMSSSPAILEALTRRCRGDHEHAPLLGGTRARDAAVYPPELCSAIAQGAAEQLRRDGSAHGLHAVAGSEHVAASRFGALRRHGLARATAEVHCEEAAAEGRVRHEDEELALWSVGEALAAKEVYDEITGAALPQDLVRQARAEEIKFMMDWGVWKRAPTTDCWRDTGKAPIGSKWVDVNKGDETKPQIRSRFVVKEIATYKSDDFFAATPPLESLRLLLSLAASEGNGVKVEVLDARKAHLHAFADRTVYTQLPPEVAEPGYCAKLVRCLYGTRDAPKRWEAFLAEQLVALGFAKGRASPCCYHHAGLGVRCIVHGDDFVLSGSAGALDEVKLGMHKRFLLKELGRLGGDDGELRELRILNRVIRWTPSGLKYEADPRHAEIVVRGVAGAERALSAPGTNSKDFESPGDEGELPEAVARLFRSFAARANYLAMDRPDLAQATKELCRRMSAPKAADLRALARVARYLAGAGRVVYEFPWQQRPVLRVYTDSDFAGCVATRFSTSGGAVMLGNHLLKHWASTQKQITLSSGEAELGAIVRGFSEALGIQSVARDLGVELQPEVHADSSAAIGICNRCGIGKVRHLAVAQLWVQHLVRSKGCRLFKVLGTENPADLMTKPLPRAEIDGHLARLGLSRATGRAETAPRADAEVDTTLADRARRQAQR
jgi:hypothetical protein